jgi:putative ABC transport system substrate-binding protein
VKRRRLLALLGGVLAGCPLRAIGEGSRPIWRIGLSSAGSSPAARENTIPVVTGYATDLLGLGFAERLSRPCTNITGLASSLDDTTAKLFELRLQVVSNVSHVGLFTNPGSPNHTSVVTAVRASTRKLGLSLAVAEVRRPEEFGTAFGRLAAEGVDGTIVTPDALFAVNRGRIAETAVGRRVPTISAQREYVVAGRLVSYGHSLVEFFRRGASYVGRILKCAEAGELPIEHPNRFLLTVNLKTAKALGLEVPPALLARADELIV